HGAEGQLLGREPGRRAFPAGTGLASGIGTVRICSFACGGSLVCADSFVRAASRMRKMAASNILPRVVGM
ncbi:MAG: hypothetical protein OSJ28_11420, partial [Desulfovibrio sp.]|nr:hypothetical protein [Desulfovibrio sp.]